MNFISTAQLDIKVLEEFFEDKWQELDGKLTLKENGYLVEYEDQYKAYFALTPVEGNSYWLKSLYIKEGVPATFPLAMIESAIAIAKEKGGDNLFVYSHQQALNSLLSLLNFKQQQQPPRFAEEVLTEEGTWWKVDPSTSTQQNQ